MIVLDTSVLSLSLRRKGRSQEAEAIARQLATLLDENIPVVVPCIVAQEILSGVRFEEQFKALRRRLEAFPLILATISDHFEAAKLVNRCRDAGITLATVDA